MNIKDTTLVQRLKAETPIWFKRIRRVGLTLAAIATALLAANGVGGFVLPQILNAPCQWLAVFGFTSAAISSTAKQ